MTPREKNIFKDLVRYGIYLFLMAYVALLFLDVAPPQQKESLTLPASRLLEVK